MSITVGRVVVKSQSSVMRVQSRGGYPSNLVQLLSFGPVEARDVMLRSMDKARLVDTDEVWPRTGCSGVGYKVAGSVGIPEGHLISSPSCLCRDTRV